ncbi:MAG: Gfo/Idh/MocA family oxidoreductase [Pirellulales bacterium]|nr:Gfo/Idh/MocA family oxidoreductase [Pirellulales bacterium]
MNSKANMASNGVNRRDFILGTLATGAVVGGGLGAFYFGYDKSLVSPLRVGVIGTGDEGCVLLGAITPDYIDVRSIADIRPYNVWRAFHGDHYSDAALEARPGLLSKYGWRNETEARRHVKVYEGQNGDYKNLIAGAKQDGVEAVIIALPLHLHAPAAIAAMEAGLHVLTEKLMAHSVRECKDMARVARRTGMILATGHQRHYNILYANAVDSIRRGLLGNLHYIRAQWHRGNMPGSDSWQQPLPKGAKKNDESVKILYQKRKTYQKELSSAIGASMDLWRRRLEQVEAQLADAVDAANFGYESHRITNASGKEIYSCPPIEELIRWRLWERTGGGLMAELGSHQLDAASIFVAAIHDGAKQMPISVAAAGNRPLFPPDRQVEDHVYCLLEFPAPGYDPDDPFARDKKIGVQYASINGNGFGGYGEIVFGDKGTMILDREQELWIAGDSENVSDVKVSDAGSGPTLDTQASDGPTTAAQTGPEKVSRGYVEQLQHWAWCIRNSDPHNQPRCGPKVALGDAIIALTANIAARNGERIEFKKEWFDPDSDETPEGIPPSVPA